MSFHSLTVDDLKTLGKVLRRPAFAPAPGFVMKILFGEMGKSLILDGQKVHPKRLLESGYTFEHETLEPALRDALGRFNSSSLSS